MAEATLFAKDGKQTGRVPLPEAVFGATPNVGLMHEAVRVYLDNQRHGTASTLTRSEVNASGRKPWRQKGTGRARAGQRNSPVWRGGGTIFGPLPRDYHREMPRKMRRLAVRSALSARAGEGAVLVLQALELPEARTRHVAALLKSMELQDQRTLLVLPSWQESVLRATRNMPRVTVRLARELTTYDVLHCDRLVVHRDALPALEEACSA